MDVGPYVPLPRRAVEERCYLKYIAVDEAVVYFSHLSFWAVQEEQRAEVSGLAWWLLGLDWCDQLLSFSGTCSVLSGSPERLHFPQSRVLTRLF